MEDNNNLQPHSDVIGNDINPVSFTPEEPVRKPVYEYPVEPEVKEEVQVPIATEQIDAVKPVEFVSDQPSTPQQPVQPQPPVPGVELPPYPGGQMEPPKKSKAPVVIIFLLLLIIGGLVAAYFFYLKPKMEALENQPQQETPTQTEKPQQEDPGKIQQMPTEEPKTEEPTYPTNPETPVETTNYIKDLKDYEAEEIVTDLSVYDALTKEDTTEYSNSYKINNFYDSTNECNDIDEFKTVFKDVDEDNPKNEVKPLDYYSCMYFLYKDNNKIKIYDNTAKVSYIVKNIPTDKYNYRLSIDRENDELFGIIYEEKEDGNKTFYSLPLDKTLYKNKYKDLKVLAKDYLEGTKKDDTLALVSTSQEKEIKTLKVNEDMDCMDCYLGFGVVHNEKATYIIIDKGLKGNVVYTEDFKEIVKKVDRTKTSVNNKGYLYVGNKKGIDIYDKTGKKVKTVDAYIPERIWGEYILTIKDKKLMFSTLEGKEYTLANWDEEKNELHLALSGWYTNEGKYGIYVVVADKNVTVDEAWKYCKSHLEECEIENKSDLSKEDTDLGYEYYFVPNTGEIGKIPTKIGAYAKPVLYLYPTKKTNVTVTFAKPENLTTTYPKYKNNWKITAYPNGDLYDQNNKYYYALYWEEVKNHNITFNEGFYVNSKNAISFLEEKLTTLGLNPKERNEFIMYWLPILERNEHSLVYFEQTEEREKYSKLTISPKPDSLLRISMHIKKVSGKTTIKEQKLNTFKRSGFTAVEWGGVIH